MSNAAQSDRLQHTPLPLPREMEDALFDLNPWWRGGAAVEVSSFLRWPYARVRWMLERGIAPATVLRGPRRVGKTTILRQVVHSLLSEGIAANRILYIAFDDLPARNEIKEPILAAARWFEHTVLGSSFNQAARDGKPALLFFDEIQNLNAWAPQLKFLVDNHEVRVLATGSSSLRIEAGRDSLAGRISTLDIGSLRLREIAELRWGETSPVFWADNGLDKLPTPEFWRAAIDAAERDREPRRRAFAKFSEFGGYPIAHDRSDLAWPEIAGDLNEAVIRRAITRDLRVGDQGSRLGAKLLETVFRLCCYYAGQAPGLALLQREVQTAFGDGVGPRRVLNYLDFLEGSMLLRLIEPIELRLKRTDAKPKICLCDHSLRASWLQEAIPLDPEGLAREPHLSDLAGRLAESILGYYFGSIPNLDVAYFPERPNEREVDFVLTVGTRRIPVEVKYRKRIDPLEDTAGLRQFLEKTAYNAPLGILVTLEDGVTVPDPRIHCISLSSLLWLK